MNCEFASNDVKFQVPILGTVAVARLMEFCREDHGTHSMITPAGDLIPFESTMSPLEGSMVWIVNRQNEEFSIAWTIGAVANYVNRVACEIIK